MSRQKIKMCYQAERKALAEEEIYVMITGKNRKRAKIEKGAMLYEADEGKSLQAVKN